MVKKYITLLLTLVAGLTLFATVARAETCTTQYGGTTVCVPNDLLINKQVQNPVSSVFVENLTSTDATFSPSSEVLFRLTIRNTSGETFNPVTVRDVFPSYLSFAAGPGSYDSSSKTLTFTLDNLLAGETRTVEILAKVDGTAAFASNQSLFCVTNFGKVTAAARPEGDDDTADLCIRTNVLGVTTLPKAGFDNLVILLPFAGMGLAGIALLKKQG